MKFDIVRAWKDETYRQTLSEEEVNALPANPAGESELVNAELESVNGGTAGFGGSFGGSFGGGFGHGIFASRQSVQSFSFGRNSCDNLVFSVTTIVAPNILSPIQPFCVNNQN